MRSAPASDGSGRKHPGSPPSFFLKRGGEFGVIPTFGTPRECRLVRTAAAHGVLLLSRLSAYLHVCVCARARSLTLLGRESYALNGPPSSKCAPGQQVSPPFLTPPNTHTPQVIAPSSTTNQKSLPTHFPKTGPLAVPLLSFFCSGLAHTEGSWFIGEGEREGVYTCMRACTAAAALGSVVAYISVGREHAGSFSVARSRRGSLAVPTRPASQNVGMMTWLRKNPLIPFLPPPSTVYVIVPAL